MDFNKDSAATIAETNDRIRKTIPNTPFPHIFTITDTVSALESNSLLELFKLVRDFNTFNEHNDPHLERDFGKIDFKGESYFWKIDYFDNELKYYEVDGRRIITLMHVSDY
jgi:hypothetical protein